jgi:hypothetical protein
VDNDQNSNNDTSNNDDENNEDNEPDGRIPDSYPHEIVPLYSSNVTVVYGDEQVIGDVIAYLVQLTTTDDIEVVMDVACENILTLGGDVVIDMEQMGSRTIMVDNMGYNIMLIVSPDEDNPGITILVYSVTLNGE